MNGNFSGTESPQSGKSRKNTLISAVVIAVILAGIAIFQFWNISQKKQEIATLQQEKTALTEEQTKLNNYIADVTQTIDEVGNKLKEVREKQVAISSLIPKAEADKSKKAQLIDDISAIQTQLQQNRQDIEDLKAKMKKSAVRIKSLENMVAKLQKEVEDNQATIAQMRATLEEKELVIKQTKETLTATQENLKKTETNLQKTEQTLEETRNTAYYIIGTAKELKEKNVIDQYGIFSKKSALTSEFERSVFTKIDIRKTREIPIDCKAKDVRIVPPRSEASYTVEDAGSNKSILKVTNQEQFWKIPYLAIIVK